MAADEYPTLDPLELDLRQPDVMVLCLVLNRAVTLGLLLPLSDGLDGGACD